MDIQYKNIKSLTLKRLIYAIATADHGNVTAAARWLNVSQPAVSSAILALESHYGMRLFTRQPAQGVTLTPFGMNVISQARLLCDQAQTVASLATPDAQISGNISICFYEAVAPFIVPRILRRLREHLPEVTVRFFETGLEGAATAPSNGQADIAITYDLGLSGDLGMQTLYELQPKIICSAQHRFAGHGQISLSDLDGEDLVLLDQPLSSQYVMGLLRARSAVPVIVAEVRSLELQRSLVANGVGVALSHTNPRSEMSYDGNRVISLELTDDIAAQRILAVCQRHGESRPVVRAVKAEMVAEFAAG